MLTTLTFSVDHSDTNSDGYSSLLYSGEISDKSQTRKLKFSLTVLKKALNLSSEAVFTAILKFHTTKQ